jgi:hypothetical protein
MLKIILPCTYGCVRGSGVTGQIIMHGTSSPDGHSFLVMPEGRVSEARPGGAGDNDLAKYIAMGAVFNDQEPLTDDFRRDVCQIALAAYGAGYDWPAIANLALNVLGRKSPLLPVGSHDHFICSQWVTVHSTAAGKIYCPMTDRWRVSPRTLTDRITGSVWLDSV